MLSEPAPRTPAHHRTINLTGFVREDGLIDIEGEITDTKTYDFPNAERGIISAGEAVHNMLVRITINEQLEIISAEAETRAGPYGICPTATRVFHRLEGLKIGPGWRTTVRKAIGGVEGCTHITELMGPVATVAYQTLYGELSKRRRERGEETQRGGGPIALTNSCIGHAEDPEAVLSGKLPK